MSKVGHLKCACGGTHIDKSWDSYYHIKSGLNAIDDKKPPKYWQADCYEIVALVHNAVECSPSHQCSELCTQFDDKGEVLIYQYGRFYGSCAVECLLFVNENLLECERCSQKYDPDYGDDNCDVSKGVCAECNVDTKKFPLVVCA